MGLLVKASEVFYGLSITDTVVFDKTGTLTYGRPTMTNVIPFGLSRKEFPALAGAIEAPSEHPLAQAVHFYSQREMTVIQPVRDFGATPDKGVSAGISHTCCWGAQPGLDSSRTDSHKT